MQEKRCFFLILGHFGPIKHNKWSAERSITYETVGFWLNSA